MLAVDLLSAQSLQVLDGIDPRQDLCHGARAQPGHHDAPDAMKTEFDRTRDQAEVAGLLGAGCAHMRKAFDIEEIDLDGLIATALDDPQAVTGEIKAFRGINFGDLQRSTGSSARTRRSGRRPSISARSSTTTTRRSPTCPITTQLKGLKLPGTSIVLDAQGRTLRRAVRGGQSPASGCRSTTFRGMCSRRSSPPRTSASTSTRASTSAA